LVTLLYISWYDFLICRHFKLKLGRNQILLFIRLCQLFIPHNLLQNKNIKNRYKFYIDRCVLYNIFAFNIDNKSIRSSIKNKRAKWILLQVKFQIWYVLCNCVGKTETYFRASKVYCATVVINWWESGCNVTFLLTINKIPIIL